MSNINCNKCGKPQATYVEYDEHNFGNNNTCPTKPCPFCSAYCWRDKDVTCDGTIIDWHARALAAEHALAKASRQFQSWRFNCLNNHAPNADVTEETHRGDQFREYLIEALRILEGDVVDAGQIARQLTEELRKKAGL